MSKTQTILKTYRLKGFIGIKKLIKDKLFPNKMKHIKKLNLYLKYFKGKNGLPDRSHTFDHNRSVTLFEHLEGDLKNEIDETDLTHLTEIIELHDLSMDLIAGTAEQFKNRSLDNFNKRCLHHHVFDFKLLQKIYDHFNIKVIDMAFVKPYHQIILGIKQ